MVLPRARDLATGDSRPGNQDALARQLGWPPWPPCGHAAHGSDGLFNEVLAAKLRKGGSHSPARCVHLLALCRREKIKNGFEQAAVYLLIGRCDAAD